MSLMGWEAGDDVVGLHLHLHGNVLACIEYTADISILMTRAAWPEVKSWMLVFMGAPGPVCCGNTSYLFIFVLLNTTTMWSRQHPLTQYK